MKSVQIFLGVLIIVGLVLLATQSFWVPSVVDLILKLENREESDKLSPLADTQNNTFPNIAVYACPLHSALECFGSEVYNSGLVEGGVEKFGELDLWVVPIAPNKKLRYPVLDKEGQFFDVLIHLGKAPTIFDYIEYKKKLPEIIYNQSYWMQ